MDLEFEKACDELKDIFELMEEKETNEKIIQDFEKSLEQYRWHENCYYKEIEQIMKSIGNLEKQNNMINETLSDSLSKN